MMSPQLQLLSEIERCATVVTVTMYVETLLNQWVAGSHADVSQLFVKQIRFSSASFMLLLYYLTDVFEASQRWTFCTCC